MVIDTLQKVRTADPNNGAYASDYQDMSALKFLADRRGIGLLLVHHLRKQGASDPFQQISGSNGLMGCRRHHLAAAAPADERHGPAAGDRP